MATQFLLGDSDGSADDNASLETRISEAKLLTIRLTKLADNLAEMERMRKELSATKWCSWDSTPENYIDFKSQVEEHLQALENEKLKLSTLRSMIHGKFSEDIRKELLGVQTSTEALRILDLKIWLHF